MKLTPKVDLEGETGPLGANVAEVAAAVQVEKVAREVRADRVERLKEEEAMQPGVLP